MDQSEFEQHLSKGEGLTIEFKRCGNQPEKDTYETICSFANRQGGSIFLGVQDDRTVSGVPRQAELSMQRNIINVVSNPNAFNLTPSLEFETIEYKEKMVLRIWVPMGSAVYRYKGDVYDRMADVDIKITSDDQVAGLYMRKRNHYSERKVYRFLSKDDLRASSKTAQRHLAAMVERGFLIAEGATRDRKYRKA
ncbi:AlbA family DNA-binding domain-containing protein [Raoultibacter phocaeensis]|uniref:AlbA family DNA-binding domain-containing protein n=1 Tax=Raoultibacter phocaeensis TaxID=2479841 RepID=UPI00111AE47A|nr:ATP-binding protein [Raoultibacter phocaeensis]